MKLVLNKYYGGFSLSKKAYKYMGRSDWDEDRGYGYSELSVEVRSDPKLVKCVEKLGAEANGLFASLKVVEIPDGVEVEIEEYDGWESAHEKHRSW